jgi:hypothetical protein
MKINRLETHDRYEQFIGSEFDIGKTCQNMINNSPYGNYPFYIFAHKREIGLDERISIFNHGLLSNPLNPPYKAMEEVPSARLIWQPRLTKPRAQENSMLFKAYPGTDNIRVIWMIPARELWGQYDKGKMTENKTVCESIHDFKNNKEKLEAKEDDDLQDHVIDMIYMSIADEAQKKILSGQRP